MAPVRLFLAWFHIFEKGQYADMPGLYAPTLVSPACRPLHRPPCIESCASTFECMYVCMHACIQTCIHTLWRKSVCTFFRKWMLLCMWQKSCIHACMRSSTHKSITLHSPRVFMWVCEERPSRIVFCGNKCFDSHLLGSFHVHLHACKVT